MTIRIGLTLCLDADERWREGRTYLYGDALYAGAIERAGGVPIILPIQHDVKALIDTVDGLVIPGGDDFLPPSPYPADVRFDPTPAAQLEFDARLLGAALHAGRPVLGICYGAQLLALEHGGTLLYDIPTDRPGADPHRLPEIDGRHRCTVAASSRLAAIVGRDPIDVNSLHHQAIATPGRGLVASGHAPDGLVEAIESTSEVFALGVQWHPERMAGPAGDGIFRALVEACNPAR